jgi:hypothetical protein
MPYTPTERNRVGEFLMQGIAGASDNIAKGIQQYRKDKQESAGYDMLLETAAQRGKSDPKFLEQFGPQLAKAAGGSLSQKRTLAGAVALYDQQRQQEDQRNFQLAQIRNFEADNARANTALQLQQDAAAQQKAQMEALAAFARDYGAPAIPGVSSAALLDAAQLPPGERLRQALGRNPGALTPQMLQTLVRYGDEAGGRARTLAFSEDPVTGTRMATYGGSILPTGVNPEKQQLRPEPITTADGTVLGYAVRNAKGALTVIKPDELKVQDRVKVLRETVADLSADPAARADAKAELDLLLKGGGKPSAPAKGGSLDDLWQKFQATRKQ